MWNSGRGLLKSCLNRSTKTIRQLVIKLALPGTELCGMIAFEFDDSGAGLHSLLASF